MIPCFINTSEIEGDRKCRRAAQVAGSGTARMGRTSRSATEVEGHIGLSHNG